MSDVECVFCGGEIVTNSRWKGVAPHSHYGTRETIRVCEECGGAVVAREYGSKRSNQLGPLTTTGTTWRIPSGCSLSVCPDCGSILRWCDHSDEADANFAAYIATEGRETPCGVEAVVVQGSYERDAKGGPVEGIETREVA